MRTLAWGAALSWQALGMDEEFLDRMQPAGACLEPQGSRPNQLGACATLGNCSARLCPGPPNETQPADGCFRPGAIAIQSPWASVGGRDKNAVAESVWRVA